MAMFQSNTNKSEKAVQSQGILNIIGQGTRITGDLISNGDFRVDGAIEGNVKVSIWNQFSSLCMVVKDCARSSTLSQCCVPAIWMTVTEWLGK